MDTNYLLSSLKALGAGVDTCKVCGALVHRDRQQAHDGVHQASYEPFKIETQVAEVGTCKLCGALVNRYYQQAHGHGDLEAEGADVGTCKICGILINRDDQAAHDRVHA